MKIEHVAMWTRDLERSKSFYEKHFACRAGEKYRNAKTGLESYFLSFESGARLELMCPAEIPASRNDPCEQHIGLIHLALSVGSEAKVVELTDKLRKEGFQVVSEPRRTGDGYFESCVFDPDENRIELTV